jgi:hypothetical protein
MFIYMYIHIHINLFSCTYRYLYLYIYIYEYVHIFHIYICIQNVGAVCHSTSLIRVQYVVILKLPINVQNVEACIVLCSAIRFTNHHAPLNRKVRTYLQWEEIYIRIIQKEFIRICKYICIYVYIYIYTYVSIYMYLHICIYMYVCMYMYVYVKYINKSLYSYIYMYTGVDGSVILDKLPKNDNFVDIEGGSLSASVVGTSVIDSASVCTSVIDSASVVENIEMPFIIANIDNNTNNAHNNINISKMISAIPIDVSTMERTNIPINIKTNECVNNVEINTTTPIPISYADIQVSESPDNQVPGYPANSVNIKGDEVNGNVDIDDCNDVSTTERTNKRNNESGILSSNTIESLLKNEWLRGVLKSKRLRDDIMNIDSSLSRQG